MKHKVSIEIRESEGVPRLHGTLITEGVAARGGRAEVFEPNSITWPSDGIAIRLEHRGREHVRAMPVRMPGGQIQIAAPVTPEIRAAVSGGRNALSIEFYPEAEVRTAGGVRAITRALVDAAALTDDPEYPTGVEVRTRRRKVWL